MRLPSNQPAGTGRGSNRSRRLTPKECPRPSTPSRHIRAVVPAPFPGGRPILPTATWPAVPARAVADQEKARAAERDIAYIRLAVILFNIAVYWPLMTGRGIPWLAFSVSAVALAYAFYVVMARPYLRYPIL